MLQVANERRCDEPLDADEIETIAQSVVRTPRTSGIAWTARADQALLGYGLTPYQVAVYLALRSFANGSGKCYPSQGTIAERARVGRTSVDKAVATLERLDLIKVKRRGYPLTHLYTVLDPTTGKVIGGEPGSTEGAWQAVMEAEDLASAES